MRTQRSTCPIHFALRHFGDAWTLLIVRDLMFKGRSTYGELQRGGEGIATNILADRLARLEDDGIVTRQVDPDHGAKVRYRLTDKGASLAPVLVEMIAWSAHHDPETAASPEFVARARDDRESLLEAITAAIPR